MMKMTACKVATLLPAFVLLALDAGGTDADAWPTKLSYEHGGMLIYRPQLESFEGNSIEARAAISIRQGSPDTVPTFAAIRFTAVTDSARSDPVLTARDIELVDLHLADASEAKRQALGQVVMQQLDGITLQIPNDYSIVGADGDERADDPSSLRSDPPRIILSAEPAMLVPIDGEPRLQLIEGSEMQWVVNSPIPIIKRQQTFYLFAGATLWYVSENVLGPWRVADLVPDEVSQAIEEVSAEDVEAFDPVPVRIIVATEPTELIVSDGEPSWSPVEGMDLLFMANTESNVFLELASGNHFLLLGGRWFRGDLRQADASWQAVANDALPAAFADIVEGSRRSEVLTHVAGTPQARTAVLENALPQMTAVQRDDVFFEAEWDGEPQFDTVATPNQDDEVLYAINTADSIFKVGETYYACEEGIWFESQSAFGPWLVATYIPDVIYTIPPSNPHHEVTYVRIYDVTPQVVYVGYTPGYLGSYTYHGSVVYGTGYHYDPWLGSHYYPHGLTWGFSPFYDPWFGWSSGIVSRYRPFRANFGHRWQHHRQFKPNRSARHKRGRDTKRRDRDHGSGYARENHRSTGRDNQRVAFNPARQGPDNSQRRFNRRENIARLQRVDPDRRLDSRGTTRQRFNVQRPALVDTQSSNLSSTARTDRQRTVEPVVDASQQRPLRLTRRHNDDNAVTLEPSDFSSGERRPVAVRPIRRAPPRRLSSDVRSNPSSRNSGGSDRVAIGRNRELREPSRDVRISPSHRSTVDATRTSQLPRVASTVKRTRSVAIKKSSSKPTDRSQETVRSNSWQTDDRSQVHVPQMQPRRARNSRFQRVR